jgi:hypothetical protein
MEVGLGQFGLSKLEPEIPANAQSFGTIIEFFDILLERLLNGDESVVELSVDGLCLSHPGEKTRRSESGSGFGHAIKTLADKSSAFTNAAKLRQRPAERHVGKVPNEWKAMLISET